MSLVRPEPSRAMHVKNFLNGGLYELVRADRLGVTQERLEQIARVCNEPAVYEWLFKDRLKGKEYTPSDSALFMAWCCRRWQESGPYAFFVVKDGGEIAACCDIKSNEAEGAEVGYWASERHRGVMTNSVVQLCALARETGYQWLSARTRKGNLRSARVLQRVGFRPQPGIRDEETDHYRLDLT
jgi:RimJ/RimL family protein N-acetyltransferase